MPPAFGLPFLGLLLGVASSLVQADQADIQRRYAQYAAVQQAVYQLAGEALDADADGTLEAAAWVVGAGVSGGGVIPPASGAPKHDGFGGALGYCVWDNGTVTASANRLAGSGLPAAPAIAVISYGLDNLFQTSCADLAVGQVKGDDYAFWLTNNQMHSAAANTVSMFWGAPVTDAAALAGLNTTALHEGEVRLVRSTNKFSRWNSGSGAWEELSKDSNWINAGADAYLAGKAAVGQAALGSEQLVVNGGALPGVLGLKGTNTLTGINLYAADGATITGFFGIDNSTGQVVIDAPAGGGTSFRTAGVERLRLATDGSLWLGGALFVDGDRNVTAAALSATTGVFSSSVSANSYQIAGLTVLAADRSLQNITNITLTGTLTINGTVALDAARNATLSAVTATSITAATGNFGSVNGVLLGLGGGGVSSNLAVGTGALWSNSTGTDNVALGDAAQSGSNTSGNIAIGYAASTAATGSGNVAIGYMAHGLAGQGDYTVAIGYQALQKGAVASTGSVAVGYKALSSLTTGGSSVAVGSNALEKNSTGTHNTAVGILALTTNTSAADNTAVGWSALTANSSGAQNTAVGSQALAGAGSSTNNTAVGWQALKANTGSTNTAVGAATLIGVGAGYGNTAVGHQALYATSSGYNNIALGTSALSGITSGYNNIGIGVNAGGTQTTAYQNIAIGGTALMISSGNNNIAIGVNAGRRLTTGSNNVILGAWQGTGFETVSGNVVLADGAGTARMRFDANGFAGVGVDPDGVNRLKVNGNILATGSITAKGSVSTGTAGAQGAAYGGVALYSGAAIDPVIACSTPGYLARDTNGSLYYCKNSSWVAL